jgi:hypothetical protein
MNTYDLSCRIKSARQKKRLVKTDRDKQLIQLDKKRKALWIQKKNLPKVPLEKPYQRGWKRFFVLREDLKRSIEAAFYEELLLKINVTQYHYDKSFKQRKRRKRNWYSRKEQTLTEFSSYLWNSEKLNLSEQEKACFTRVEIFDVKGRGYDIKYVLTKPWRYTLKIAPYMVTHIKLMDVDLERELSFIDNYIKSNKLQPRINLLIHGRSYHWSGWYYEPIKYINKLKNTPRYTSKEAYLDLET